MDLPEKKLTIGWYMSEKKVIQLHWNDFVSFAEAQGHKVIKLDLNQDYSKLLSKPHFDVLLLKMTDELVRESDEVLGQMVTNARIVIDTYPRAALIDPIDAQALTINRESMHHFFSELNRLPSDYHIRCPRGYVLNTVDDYDQIPNDFKFPCMIKQMQASGALEAHDMAVVWKIDDFEQFKHPIYAQEYINHNGTIFKVYVMGDNSNVVTRVSLPNFPAEYRAPVRFNSQDWKHDLPEEYKMEYTGKRSQPSDEIIRKASKQVSELLGLTMFGYDVIVDIDTGKLAIIDVNYFPDYKGVSDVFPKLLQHIKDRYHAAHQS